MAKKKQSKVVQMLSPENYIRQKARTLPIHKCFVNSDWKQSGLANILVSRKHTNGNFTLGTYLIDVNCLGVKDSGYNFNVSEPDFNIMLDRMHSYMEIQEITYTLAHNIVYAGLEFAEEYGFKPHNDFIKVAQYILEEDTESIELIDIECGKDGKPFYISGPYDTDVKKRAIIAMLEKNAGPGNFDFAVDDELDDMSTGDFEPDDFDDSDYFPGLNFDEEEVRNSHTLQLKIVIDGLDNPDVWRRVSVPSYYTLALLHHLIQRVFGWENEHLYEFYKLDQKSKTIIGELEDQDEPDSIYPVGREIPIGRLLNKEGYQVLYTYDFGDSWDHTITLEKVIPEVSLKPELLEGNGACPPEDCGGIMGYKDLMSILANKKHPEYNEYREWMGLDDDESWDPNAFDFAETQLIISEIFQISD